MKHNIYLYAALFLTGLFFGDLLNQIKNPKSEIIHNWLLNARINCVLEIYDLHGTNPPNYYEKLYTCIIKKESWDLFYYCYYLVA